MKRILMFPLLTLLLVGTAFAAECTPTYGGGEECIVNERVGIKKQVRVCQDENTADCTEWRDKVVDVKKDEHVQFRVVIKNLSDTEADEFDNMKMVDDLPSEMTRTGGDGLTESWDNFAPGNEKTFLIWSIVNASEYDASKEFEKCVVNKASVYVDDEFGGSSTATVCYGGKGVTDLPKTGAGEIIVAGGILMVFIGALGLLRAYADRTFGIVKVTNTKGKVRKSSRK